MSPRSSPPTRAADCSALSLFAPRALRLLAGLALLTTPALAQVKLSQVYGAGGNAGTAITNDYIEIYNSGAPQDLTGWSVQYASSTGTTWTVNALPSVVLGTGKYLLIQEAIGTTVVAGQAPALPPPDVTGTTSMSATDAKVALCNSITALAGGTPTYTANPTLVDFVGFGTAANWNDTSAAGGAFLAANNAALPSTVNALFRRGCGGQDTNSSRDDWAQGFPSPRNAALPAAAGINAAGYSLPQTIEELQTARLVATPFRCGTYDLGAGTVGAIDTTLIGGGPGVPMLDNGAAPDEIAGDGIFTANVVIGAGTTTGTKSLPVTFSDAGGNSGACYISLVVSPAATTPDNDNCFGAQTVAVPSTTAGNWTGATYESNPFTSAGAAPTTGFGSRRGLWYKVTGNGNTLTASLCNTAPALDTVLLVMAGTCDGLTIIATGDDGGPACTGTAGSASWCSIAGQSYFVWVAPFAGGASVAPFTLDILDSGTPCATGFPVTVCTGVAGPYSEAEPGFGPGLNEGCGTSPNTFTNIATPSFPASVYRGTSRGMYGTRDVDCYRFLATVSDTISMTVETFGSANAQAQLNSLTGPTGICPQVSVVNTPIFVTRCANGALQTSAVASVTAGTWYTINIVGGIGLQVTPPSTAFGGQMPGGSTYQYKLSVTIGGPPANETCATATALAGASGTSAGNTTSANFEGFGSSCDPTGKDVWYSFAGSTDAGTLNLNTCTTPGLDTVISVYDACGGNQIACNDDGTGTPCAGPSSALAVPIGINQSVKIRVSTKGGPGGSFVLTYSFVVPPPANDECSTATSISGSGSFVADTRFATPTTATAPGSVCQSLQSRDVWFKWTSSQPGLVNLDTCGAAEPVSDSVITVYTGACGTLTEIACDDDTCTTPDLGSQTSFTAACATTYYIRVSQYNLTIPTTAWTLHVAAPASVDTDGDGIIDCLDGCPLDPLKIAPGVCGCGNPETDTDGDGTPNCIDGCPLDPLKIAAGFCGCGNPETDTDGDGSPDCVDGCPSDPSKTAPGFCGCGNPETDGDGDGTPDCIDGCPSDPNKIAPGVCGCGTPDTDTDNDGTPDCNDGCPTDPNKIAPGICGCGSPDVDTDGDGTLDCFDGCPLDPLKIAPGACGCGVPDTDTDADGIANCVDNCPTIANPSQTDADNDLVGDACDNCPAHFNPSQADCDNNGMGDVCEIALGSQPDCDLNGLPDNCEPDCNTNGQADACDISAATSLDLNGNGVPDECEARNGFTFCSGDGTGAPCPCGNNGLPDEGCVNSTGRGAKLYNAGGTSVFLDNAAPLSIQMPGNKLMLFVMGPTPQNGGNGVPFFDGLLCVNVQKRFASKLTSGSGTAVQLNPAANSSGLITPGSTWLFQAWHRDSLQGPCATRANLSNGLGITFTP